MINQMIGNILDGSMNNIYLRKKHGQHSSFTKLIGINSPSTVCLKENSVLWHGSWEGIEYELRFLPGMDRAWFWEITINGDGGEAEVIYGQDLGLGDAGMVRNNEAYASQYIDHQSFWTEEGWVVCSRQNQPQEKGHPFLQQGALTGVKGYSTDGFQFFGESFRTTEEPVLLQQAEFPNEVYQYEFAYTALQSHTVTLNNSQKMVFYAVYKENHEEAVENSLPVSDILLQYEEAAARPELSEKQSGEKFLLKTGSSLRGESLSDAELEEMFPERQQEEKIGGKTAAFFTPTAEHVVLPIKEEQMERPHGHIILSGKTHAADRSVITTTSYMYGLFNSQMAVGNTSFHKLMTNARNPLNIPKTSGQRLYIKAADGWRLLTMPSLFEMGFNYATWYYKLGEDMLTITVFTKKEREEVQLDVSSRKGITYRFLITSQLSMHNHEYEVPYQLENMADGTKIFADEASDSAKVYPELSYRMIYSGTEVTRTDETALLSNSEPGEASLLVHETGEAASWSLLIQGSLTNEHPDPVFHQKREEAEAFLQLYEQLVNGFHLEASGYGQAEAEKMNIISRWYTHNMLIHYTVPHGLEQYGAAAWGTRDVCQGPAEYFLAVGRFEQVKHILLKVYSQQFEDTGGWPQWFMFDAYETIKQEESHGDIIVWPLKLLADYLEASGDTDILNESVSFTDRSTMLPTKKQTTLEAHVERQIAYIKEHFLHDTHLSSYGDGDWDDTLQPANRSLKDYMVSTWTVALTYQTFERFGNALPETFPLYKVSLKLKENILRDYEYYFKRSGTLPGFLYLEDPEKPEVMLHPDDQKTGIGYRLLPMTRSMIAGLLKPKEAEDHFETIKKHLYFPDGVRLMNRPASYQGGVSHHFKRAEQAANFGREIGLQYVHAHIRFVEAMAAIGKEEETWKGMQVINPVNIADAVPNARTRQSNAYFSSSDGAFLNRKEAAEKFDELRDGKIPVKGGWRIYSSGPGIYMHQLISNVLGIRRKRDMLILDPVLPQYLDGLTFHYRIDDKPLVITYHMNQSVQKIAVDGREVYAEKLNNQYRQGGFSLPIADLRSGKNNIDVYLKS
ncbi:MAG: cellobiose phosphorylase [Alkalicoccus sp.]|nr:MAG: cellobiose phosphorylase [Alkalicoccus sp.]